MTTMNTGAASLSDEQRTTIQHAADKLRTVWANHTGDKESRELCHKLEAILATTAQADADFKNFHRLLCERFDYVHDEKDWKRDQVSLIEWIAKRLAPAAPSVEQDERGAFEASFKAWTGQSISFDKVTDDEDDERYADEWLQGAWIGWQARAASTSANVAQLDMSLEARLTDAEADVKRLHAEKMELWNQVHGYSANVAQGDSARYTMDQMRDYALAFHEARKTGAQTGVCTKCPKWLFDERCCGDRALPANVAQGAEAVAVVDENDDGLFVEILQGENGTPLKCGDKLYAAPPAQTALTDDARDAARYRFLRAGFGDMGPEVDMHNAFVDGGEVMDRTIDAALTAAQSASGDTK